MNYVSSSVPTGKLSGQFFTPEPVARTLVGWVVTSAEDSLLDPSCGDGNILIHHSNSYGIETDPYFAWVAQDRCPASTIENADFFTWALTTTERFDCVAGNPPFIRYQGFKGMSKLAASKLCDAAGMQLSGLSATWPAFVVSAAGLLKPGGRMAFVIPAEIGHASYSRSLLEFLVRSFTHVQIVAVREKLFPRLSEDCWLLYTEGYGGSTEKISFTTMDTFIPSERPPTATVEIDLKEWRGVWNYRLRPYVLPQTARDAYVASTLDEDICRFRDFAKIGIGYITGGNDFFHLRPSEALRLGIPRDLLMPTIRNGRALPNCSIDGETVAGWIDRDEQALLLLLDKDDELPDSVKSYLDSEVGLAVRESYKCRVRRPWYAVPGVTKPDYILQYMSGRDVKLVRNPAGVACTNSVHAISIFDRGAADRYLPNWGSPLTRLSCELEGHALGGGMLKLEPREAGAILFPGGRLPEKVNPAILENATLVMERWRHYVV